MEIRFSGLNNPAFMEKSGYYYECPDYEAILSE